MAKKSRAIGSPTVFTEEVVRKLEEAFCMDATVDEACAFAGIGASTYYDECKRNPVFLEKMERAQRFPFMLAKKTVIEAMKTNDGNLAMKWLKNRQRDRYHEKVEQETRIKEDPAADLLNVLMNQPSGDEQSIEV